MVLGAVSPVVRGLGSGLGPHPTPCSGLTSTSSMGLTPPQIGELSPREEASATSP